MRKTRGVPILMTAEALYSADDRVPTIIRWLRFFWTPTEMNHSADSATVSAEAFFSVEIVNIRPDVSGSDHPR